MFTSCPSLEQRKKADLLIFPFFQQEKKAQAAVQTSEFAQVIDPILAEGDFDAKRGKTLLVYLDHQKERRLLFLGLGEEKDCSREELRRCYAAAIKRCQNKKWSSVNVLLPKMTALTSEQMERAIIEGIGLSIYLFEGWKGEGKKAPFYVNEVTLIGGETRDSYWKTEAILSGVHLARDLINGNALDVTPQFLGQVAKDLGNHYSSIKAKVHGKKELEKEKMGLLLAVGSGSRTEPALIQLEYKGDPESKDLTLLVGKGITFDTGGLNLKPTGFIEDMRTDMSGGAAVLGVIKAAAEMKLKANLLALIPATENSIDAESYKPGDVYTSCNGLTVEITNTDAEGRLALADALTFGQRKFSPNRIVDLATLTGAVVVALGSVRTGLFSNDEKMARAFYRAGEETGERVWEFPLDEDYQELLKSSIADCKNAATKRSAGSITAAMFLKQFIEKDTPWVHLDIAGTARLETPQCYHMTHVTGVGVRLVIEWLENLHL